MNTFENPFSKVVISRLNEAAYSSRTAAVQK